MVDEQTPLMDHLERLRQRLMIAGGCWLICFFALLSVAGSLFDWVSASLQQALPAGSSVVFLSATEPVLTYLTIAAVTALIVSLPVILWQLWMLAAAAFYPQKLGHGLAFVLISYLCFLVGAWAGFSYVFPAIIKVLLQMGSDPGGLDAMISMADYLSLALKMMIAFGMVCELPMVMIVLARMRLVDRSWFIAKRKYMIIVGFVFGAVVTPGPDVISQCSIAIPFVILYEVGIILCGFFSVTKVEVRQRASTFGDASGGF